MTSIRYVGPESEGVTVDGIVFAPGEPVDVEPDLARRLLEQETFSRSKTKKNDDPAAAGTED